MSATHTYAILHISEAAYQEIRSKLLLAGYEDQFHGAVVDLHGIAVVADPGKCPTCNVGMVRCKECARTWCLDHQPNPLRCPGCGARP